jgi:hypothetical protein
LKASLAVVVPIGAASAPVLPAASAAAKATPSFINSRRDMNPDPIFTGLSAPPLV